MVQVWHPWRELGRRYPEIVVSNDYRLPAGVRGMWKERTVWLCSTLTQAERRSALTHELEHLKRGLVAQPWRRREERIVDELAARKLIPIGDLLCALRWARDDYELADELWTDVHTVRTRRETLTEEEKEWLSKHLDDGMSPC